MMNTIKMLQLRILLPHEQVSSRRTFEVREELLTLQSLIPLAVDQATFVVLDGHHRLRALKELGFQVAPCELFDYVRDTSIQVSSWRSEETITKSDVLHAGLRSTLMRPKSSRHLFAERIFERIPLSAIEAR